MPDDHIVSVSDLTKYYGPKCAVDHVDFSMERGTIFGLLGPNGAGKTSIIEMIEGVRRPDSGAIRVNGIDAVRSPQEVKQIIGGQLQSTGIHERLRVREVLELFQSFYKRPYSSAELLEMVDLADERDSYFRSLSGGQKQRVSLALALVGRPLVLFLDEPTTGLDADIRRTLHSLILRLRKDGLAIFLTTHYIEEAERLCDQIGILQHGRLLAISSPQQIIAAYKGKESLKVLFQREVSLGDLRGLHGVEQVTREEGGWYTMHGSRGDRLAVSVASFAQATQNAIQQLRIEQPSLEDVYLKITGATQ